MFDKELVKEILTQINTAVQRILVRFEPVKSVSDFTNTPAGMEKLAQIRKEVEAELEAAVAFGFESPLPEREVAVKDVYKEAQA